MYYKYLFLKKDSYRSNLRVEDHGSREFCDCNDLIDIIKNLQLLCFFCAMHNVYFL